MSYPGHSLEEYYHSAEMQLVYSTAPTADWADRQGGAHVIMDVFLGNGHGHLGSSARRGWLHFSYPWEKLESSYSFSIDE